jgi:hypothetical protein
MRRVLASATVDTIKPAGLRMLGTYHVEVWGQPPLDFARVYKIQAKSEDQAAKDGIDKFVAEMEVLELPDAGAPC